MSAVLVRRSLLSLCLLTAWAVSGQAWAQDPVSERGQREAPRRGEPARAERPRDTLADSVRRFERSRGGRVLSAERMQSDGRDVSRIKAMDDRGRVRVFVDDPQRRQPPVRDRRTRGDDD
jgi:hypothetical protein